MVWWCQSNQKYINCGFLVKTKQVRILIFYALKAFDSIKTRRLVEKQLVKHRTTNFSFTWFSLSPTASINWSCNKKKNKWIVHFKYMNNFLLSTGYIVHVTHVFVFKSQSTMKFYVVPFQPSLQANDTA